MSLAAAAAVLAETEGAHRELPAPPWVFAVAALVVFAVLLYVTTRFDPDR